MTICLNCTWYDAFYKEDEGMCIFYGQQVREPHKEPEWGCGWDAQVNHYCPMKIKEEK